MKHFIEILQGLSVGLVVLLIWMNGPIQQMRQLREWENRRWPKSRLVRYIGPLTFVTQVVAWYVVSFPVTVTAKLIYGW